MEAQEFILVIQTTGQPLAPSANRIEGRWPEVGAQKPLGDNFFFSYLRTLDLFI